MPAGRLGYRARVARAPSSCSPGASVICPLTFVTNLKHDGEGDEDDDDDDNDNDDDDGGGNDDDDDGKQMMHVDDGGWRQTASQAGPTTRTHRASSQPLSKNTRRKLPDDTGVAAARVRACVRACMLLLLLLLLLLLCHVVAACH